MSYGQLNVYIPYIVVWVLNHPRINGVEQEDTDHWECFSSFEEAKAKYEELCEYAVTASIVLPIASTDYDAVPNNHPEVLYKH